MSEYQQQGSRPKPQTGKGSTLATGASRFSRHTNTSDPNEHSKRPVSSSTVSPKKENSQHHHSSSTDSGRSSISGSHCGEVGESTSKDLSPSLPPAEVGLVGDTSARQETSTKAMKNADDLVSSSSPPVSHPEDGHQLIYSGETGGVCNDLDIYSDVTLIPRVSEPLTVIYKSGRPCVKRVSRSKVDKTTRKQKSMLQQQLQQQPSLEDSTTVRQGVVSVVTSSSSGQSEYSAPGLAMKEEACVNPTPPPNEGVSPSDGEVSLSDQPNNASVSDQTSTEDKATTAEEEYVKKNKDDSAMNGLIVTGEIISPDHSLAITSEDQASAKKICESDKSSNRSPVEGHSPGQGKIIGNTDEPDPLVSSTSTVNLDQKVTVPSNAVENPASGSSTSSSVSLNKTESSVNSGAEHSSPEHKLVREAAGLRSPGSSSFRKSNGHQPGNEFTRRRTRPGSSPALPGGNHNASSSNRALHRNLSYHVRPLLVSSPYGAQQTSGCGLLPARRCWTDKQKRAANPSPYSVQPPPPGNPVTLLPTSLLSQANSCMCLQPMDSLATLLVNPGFTWWLSPGSGTEAPRGRTPTTGTDCVSQSEADVLAQSNSETLFESQSDIDKRTQSSETVQSTKKADKSVDEPPATAASDKEFIPNGDTTAVNSDKNVTQLDSDVPSEAAQVEVKSAAESPGSDVTSTATTVVNGSQGSDTVPHNISSQGGAFTTLCEGHSVTGSASTSAPSTTTANEGLYWTGDIRMLLGNPNPKDIRTGFCPVADYATSMESCYMPTNFVYFCNSDGQLFAVPSAALICHQTAAQNFTKSINGEGMTNSELGSGTDSAYNSPPSLGPGYPDTRLLSHAYGISPGPGFDSANGRATISVSTATDQDLERSNVFPSNTLNSFYADGQHQQLLHHQLGLPYHHPTAINASTPILQPTYLGDLSGWPVWSNEANAVAAAAAAGGMAPLQVTSSSQEIQQLLLPFTSLPVHLSLGLSTAAGSTNPGNVINDSLIAIDQQTHYQPMSQGSPHGQVKAGQGGGTGTGTGLHRHIASMSLNSMANRMVSASSIPLNAVSSTTVLSSPAPGGGHQRYSSLNPDSKTSRLYRIGGVDTVGLLGSGGATAKLNAPLQHQQVNGGSKTNKTLHYQQQQQEQTDNSRCLDEYGSRSGQAGHSHSAKQKKHTSKTNLYIRGLPSTYTEDQLHNLAPDRDLIRSVKLIAGSEGEMYGFIDFVNNAAAKLALVHIKSVHRDLYVNFAYESEKDPHNVYITNIPETWTATNVEDLKKIFQVYGQIATAIVMTKRSNNFCTGAGFVRFTKAEDAQKAIDEIRSNKITLEGGRGPLEVKLADRQKPLEDQTSLQSIDGIDLVRASDLHVLRNPYISGRQRSANKKFTGDDTRYALSENSGSLVDTSGTSGHRHHLGHVMRRPPPFNSCFSSHSSVGPEEGHKSILRASPVSLLPSGMGAGLLPSPQHSLSHAASAISYPSHSNYVNAEGRFHTGHTSLAVALQAALTSAQLVQHPNLHLLPQTASLNLHALPSMMHSMMPSEVTAQTPTGLLTYPTPAGHLATGFGIRNPTSVALFQNPGGFPTTSGLIPILRTMEEGITAHTGAGQNLTLSRQHQPAFMSSAIHQGNWNGATLMPGVFAPLQ